MNGRQREGLAPRAWIAVQARDADALFTRCAGPYDVPLTMITETEIAGMLRVLKQEGYAAEYRRSVSTHADFPLLGTPPEIHIFTLTGREEGRDAYLWPHGNETSKRPYALVVQTDDVRSWRDVARNLLQAKGLRE